MARTESTDAGLTLREMAARAAEERLGRNLTDGELHLDIIGYGRDLDAAKAKLAEAVQAEVRRAARAHATGRGDTRIQLTPEMEAVLQDLYETGVGHARREQQSMGIREFADDEPESPRTIRGVLDWVRKRQIAGLPIPEKILRLVPILVQLASHLQALDLRMRKEAVAADLGKMAQARMAEVLERKVPGALDAAGRVVSSAMTGGLAATWDKVPGIPEWVYSAVMDGNTCNPCRSHDGMRFPSLEQAYTVLPNFGPNPLCFGDGRCRCRLVPELGPGVATPSDVPPRPAREIPLSEIVRVRTTKLERDTLGERLENHSESAVELIEKAAGGPLVWDTPPRDLDIRWGSTGGSVATHKSRAAGWADPGITVDRIRQPGLIQDFRMTLIHEIGHWLDSEYFGRSQFFGRGDSPSYGGSNLWMRHGDKIRFPDEMRDVMVALRDSRHYQQLFDVQVGAHNPNIPNFDHQAEAAYRLRGTELFARAFTQWVAYRSDDQPSREHISDRLRIWAKYEMPWYWEPQDFIEIGAALDRLFARARQGGIDQPRLFSELPSAA